MDNQKINQEESALGNLQVNSMPSQPSGFVPNSQNTSPVQPARSADPLGQSLGVSTAKVMSEPSIPAPLIGQQSFRSRLNLKLAILLSLVILLFGGGAYAWFFTDLKYKLPWFTPSEDKLVAMMYEKLSQLDGADFALTYKLSVGERDADVKVDEKKVSTREAGIRASSLQSRLSYSYQSAIRSCFTQSLSLQAFAGQNCDGSINAKPKAGEFFCQQSTDANIVDDLEDYDYGGLYGDQWVDLSDYEWEYDGACTSDPVAKTYSFSLSSTYNDDKITCDEKKCTWNNEDLMDFDNGDSAMNLDLLFGSYLDGLEDYVSSNFKLEATLSGSGFSLKDRAEEKKQLPDVGLGVDAQAELGSMNAKIKLEAKVIDDNIFYKISDFPFTDITQGYEDQWIKVDADDDIWINSMLPHFSDEQNKAIIDFRNFVAKTNDYNVLTFDFSGDYIEKDGLKMPVFTVNFIPENVPNWLQDLRDLYAKNQSISGVEVASKQYTEEEKAKIVTKVTELMNNIKMKATLHPGTGDLMNLTFDFRIIPSADSKKFAGKQFNSSLSVDVWNHNKPTSPQVPDNFVEQSEIERERLGYSKEAYQDIKQAKRIERIRQDLLSYYNEHKAWPQKLSEASSSIVDYNTGKEYPYQILGSNYLITYQMSDVEQKAEPKISDSYYFGYTSKIRGFGANGFTQTQEFWDKGENKADRYSPVAHKYTTTRQWLVNDTVHYDLDVLEAISQAKMVYSLGRQIESFYTKNNRYPDDLDELNKQSSTNDDYFGSSDFLSSSLGRKKYFCEDLLSAQPCQYEKNGSSYTLKVSYKLSADNIDQKILDYNKYSMTTFQAGINTYDPSNITKNLSIKNSSDLDRDGLIDTQEKIYGTDVNKPDTDGDGYLDGEEVKNGYNPNGPGKLK